VPKTGTARSRGQRPTYGQSRDTNLRSGVDGGEHSAMLESVMAGDAIQGHVRALICGQIFLQIMVMIARGSAHTPVAHPPDNSKPYSCTCHAARHDVNDPP
jgi:hypothetical protein